VFWNFTSSLFQTSNLIKPIILIHSFADRWNDLWKNLWTDNVLSNWRNTLYRGRWCWRRSRPSIIPPDSWQNLFQGYLISPLYNNRVWYYFWSQYGLLGIPSICKAKCDVESEKGHDVAEANFTVRPK
jgi:hypothetical protein